MANFAQVNIQFTEATDLNNSFGIKFVNSSRSIDVTFTWICKSVRSSAFQYKQATEADLGDRIIEQADELNSAMFADISSSFISGFIDIGGINDDTVTVVAGENGWVITTTFTIGNAIFTEIPEVLPVKNFQLLAFSLAQAVLPCANIEVSITENDGVSPYTWISPANPSTTLSADIARTAANQIITVILQDDEGDQASLANVTIPRLFTSVEISDISVVANAGGLDATVTVFMGTQDFGTYQFSIDGSNFQLSNVFTNVVDGSYTLFVNDGFGCITNTGFTVDVSQSIERDAAVGLVPTANSMRMVQRITSRFNNLKNTLYQDERYPTETKHDYFQLYQTNDGVIITQFRSNYDGLSVKIVDCDGVTIQTPSIAQKSNNISARDSRDVNVFNFGNNQTGIFFTEGNTYDPGTNDIIGTFNLLGALPDWGVVGNTVVLTGGVVGSFVIKQVIFDSRVQAQTLVIDNIWTSGNFSEVAISDVTYNRLPYEVFEFNVDLATIAGGVYSNELTMIDSLEERPTLIFDSERYLIAAEHRKTAFIDYFISKGTGIDYDTGYQGHIRLLANDPEASPLPGGEIVALADSGGNIQKLKDSPTMSGEMWIEAQPRYMIEKLRLIFAHKRYFINGLEWQNEEAFERVAVEKSSLDNATIIVQRVGYEAFKTDNISIDGPVGEILHEEGPILF
jgi:hypothetical protein